MATQEAFEKAAEEVKKLPESPSNDVLLRLYGLYKQGSEGDATGERPDMTDFRGRMKYDAWAEKAGVSQEDARQQYIDLVAKLKSDQ